MTARPVFGVTEPPKDTGERMAYIARGACGHIQVVQADSRRASLQDFIGYVVLGMTVERVPSQQVRDEGFCSCPRAEQIQLGV